jgi:hypothetical protein
MQKYHCQNQGTTLIEIAKVLTTLELLRRDVQGMLSDGNKEQWESHIHSADAHFLFLFNKLNEIIMQDD